MSEPLTEDAPVCYRHSDRETWVRCTRCDRPICPDCMRDAAVGFQCPDCVREGNKTVRERRTVFGGRAGADGTVTKAIIAVNIAAFLVEEVSSEFLNDFSMSSVGVASGEYYRLFTAAFLHAGLIHIAFNMYALFAFGTVVEQALGRVRFIGVYVLSTLGGSALSYLLHAPLSVVDGRLVAFHGVGASGAVFGLFGAYFVIAKRMRADTSQIVGLIALNLFLGFALRGVIDNWAHLGGLATGAALTFVMSRVPRGPRQGAAHALAFAAAAIVIVGVVVVRTPQVRDAVRLAYVSESAPPPAVPAAR